MLGIRCSATVCKLREVLRVQAAYASGANAAKREGHRIAREATAAMRDVDLMAERPKGGNKRGHCV